MENSHLRQLIISFSALEKREIRKLLQSPYFNQRVDLLHLFDEMCVSDTPGKAALKKAVLGKTNATDQELRLRMTYLLRLLERYIAQKEFEQDEIGVKIQLAAGLRKRGLAPQFERVRRGIAAQLEAGTLRDSQYYQQYHQLHWETHQIQSGGNQPDLAQLRAASDAADIAYLSQKLRMICMMTAYSALYVDGHQAVWMAEVLEFAEKNFAHTHPSIAVYLHCYRMMRFPEEDQHFHAFKQVLLDGSGNFSDNEMHGLYIWAVNYCVRQLNSGNKSYFREVLDLYKPGLEKGYLHENGQLSRYTYHNAVAAGLQTGEHDWVRYFINTYKNDLEKQYRESAFSFNLARLEFAGRNFGSVLELLQKVNYRDVLINLATKAMLLKTYFELDEYDLLQSHIDAMQNYIHRKRVIGYHRSNYLNLIKYTLKLLNINYLKEAELQKLRESIANEEHLTERDWLFEKLITD